MKKLNLKTKRSNEIQRIDLNKRKCIDYADIAHKEAISKLKYLLGESYTLQPAVRTSLGIKEQARLKDPDSNTPILFESRISELQTQLAQTKLELCKAKNVRQIKYKQLSKNGLNSHTPQMEKQLTKLRSSGSVQKGESEATRIKTSIDSKQEIRIKKCQCEMEIKRLKEELNKQNKEFKKTVEETYKYINEERQQVEQKYNQQLTQLMATLFQKQELLNNLKTQFQNKISTLESRLNQTLAAKDITEHDLLATTLILKENEKQYSQEQNELQSEVSTYKQELERAKLELDYWKKENLKLVELIESLEKQVLESKNQTASIGMDSESKNEDATMRGITTVKKIALASKKKRTIKLDLKLKIVPKQKLF